MKEIFDLCCYWTGFVFFVLGGFSALTIVWWKCFTWAFIDARNYAVLFQIAADYFERKRKSKKADEGEGQ